MWLGQLGSFGWYVPRWVLAIWVDRMGDEVGASGGGPGSVVYPWVACRLVDVGRSDAVGDEAGVPVGRGVWLVVG